MVIPWYWLALGTALLITAVTLLQKQQMQHEKPIGYITVLSIWTLVLSLVLIPWVDFRIGWEPLGLMFIASAIVALASWLTATALRHLDVSVVSPQTALSGVFAVLLAGWFLGERLELMQWAGVVVLLGGSMLLSRDMLISTPFVHHAVLDPTRSTGLKSNKASRYQLVLVLAMFLLGVGITLEKSILAGVPTFTYLFYIHVCSCVNHLLLYGVINRGWKGLFSEVEHVSWRMALIAILAMVSRLLWVQTLVQAPVSLAVSVKRTSSVWSTIFGGRLFHEKHVLVRTIIAAGMLGGVWLLIVG